MSEHESAAPALPKSQLKRLNSTAVGMLMAVGVSIALLLPIILFAPPKKTPSYVMDVDVAKVAAEAGTSHGFQPTAPAGLEGWHANHAQLDAGSASKVPTWTVGYITAEGRYLEFTQTNKANDTWILQKTAAPQTGSQKVNGTTWSVYTPGEGEPTWVGRLGQDTFLLKGNGTDEEFRQAAQALAAAHHQPSS